MKEKIKICLVNRNYPPSIGATGYFARQLVSFLKKNKNFDVSIISISEKSRLDKGHITVKGIYGGKRKFLRLFSSFFESYMLLKKAKKTKAAIYIVMTDPPFLTYWASRIFRHRKWVNWTMDIFPDAFAANNLVTKDNWFYRRIVRSITKQRPDFLITLGPNQSAYLNKYYFQNIPSIAVPVGLRSEHETGTFENSGIKENIKFGYVGNLGEAHDSEMLFQLIKLTSAKGFEFVLSCTGTKAEVLINEVSGLPNVNVHMRVSDEEMQNIDIHVVSLSEGWTHICVPSKALTALQFGGAVLFLGYQESDTWQYVKSSGWCLQNEHELDNFTKKISLDMVREKRSNSRQAYKNLLHCQEHAFNKIQEELVRLAEEKEK